MTTTDDEIVNVGPVQTWHGMSCDVCGGGNNHLATCRLNGDDAMICPMCLRKLT